MRSPVVRLTRASMVACALLLSACGGGGSGDTPAPTALSYPSAPALTVGVTIAALDPTVSGTATSFSVTPALPAGLSLSASTGVISGMPTAITARADYTVTASNGSGSTSTALSLIVNDKPPAIAYDSAYYSFTAGIASQALKPVTTGGAVTAWSVSPVLPAGLLLDSRSGMISGVPTAASPAASYAVTAANSGGSTTSMLILAVSAGPLLDLGHVASVSYIGFSSGRVLSQDTTGHWALWNYASDQELASGDALSPLQSSNRSTVALAGSTAVIQTAAALTVLDASSGAVEATISAAPSWVQLALDGSYVCAGSSAGLTVWTPSGQPLISLSGNYSNALVLAAHGMLEIARGPATGVVQTVNVLTGATSQSPAYQGSFGSWFADGSRFLTSVGSGTASDPATLFVYSSAGVQQEVLGSVVVVLGNPPDLGGEGNWFWTFDGSNLSVYAVGGGSTPSFTGSYPIGSVLFASGATLGLLSNNSLGLVDLTGVVPASSNVTLPFRDASAFAAASTATWIAGNSGGVLLDGASLGGTPRYLDYGQVQSIAGSTGNFALATASGQILVYDTATNTIGTTIGLQSTQLALSSDGTVLAASILPPYAGSSTLDIYDLPTTTPTNTIALGSGYLQSLSASGSGQSTQLGLTFSTVASPVCTSEVITVTASSPSWCGNSGAPARVLISPDGTGFAVASDPQPFSNASTTLYSHGTLSTAIPASILGWLDDTTLLGNEFVVVGEGRSYDYSKALIFNAAGSAQGSPPLPLLYGVQVLSATSVYAANPNVIFALPGGNVLWRSGSAMGNGEASIGPGQGVISGNEAVFPSANFLLAEPVPAY